MPTPITIVIGCEIYELEFQLRWPTVINYNELQIQIFVIDPCLLLTDESMLNVVAQRASIAAIWRLTRWQPPQCWYCRTSPSLWSRLAYRRPASTKRANRKKCGVNDVTNVCHVTSVVDMGRLFTARPKRTHQMLDWTQPTAIEVI